MYSNRIWHLLARKLTGDATLEELQELDQFLLADPELAASVEMQVTYFERQPGDVVAEADKAAWQKQLQRLQQEFPADFRPSPEPATDTPTETAKKGFKRWYAVAALFLIALSGFLIWYVDNGAAAEKNKIIVQNDKKQGEPHVSQKRITLPDGSLVWLNKNSYLSYNKSFGIDNREITLSGEAFFDVAHKAELPMVVHAGLVSIKVKGTAFNVSAYSDDNKVETSLVRGVVELSIKGGPSKGILMKPNEKVIVAIDSSKKSYSAQKASAVNLTINKLTPESKSGLIPELAWVENKLVFSNLPFPEVKDKLERWYDVKINVENRSISNERFTGVVSSESLDTFLKALQLTYSFKYNIDNEVVTIY